MPVSVEDLAIAHGLDNEELTAFRAAAALHDAYLVSMPPGGGGDIEIGNQRGSAIMALTPKAQEAMHEYMRQANSEMIQSR